MKSKRKALKNLTQEKIVNIGDYRDLRNGRSVRRLAVVTTDQDMIERLQPELQTQAEISVFDGRFSLEQALKTGEWDGVLLDERTLHEDALSLCEKIKKQTRAEELFVVILSDQSTKDLVRAGYEKGCDEWITRVDDVPHLARLLSHHLVG
jgi:DNA-binding response OmpR family regulator